MNLKQTQGGYKRDKYLHHQAFHGDVVAIDQFPPTPQRRPSWRRAYSPPPWPSLYFFCSEFACCQTSWKPTEKKNKQIDMYHLNGEYRSAVRVDL